MAKKGAMTKDPKYTTQPVKTGREQTMGGESDMKGDIKTIRRGAEQAARRTPVERLSPGVYRSASGDLVTQGGRPIQRQPQPQTPQNPWGNPQYDNMVNLPYIMSPEESSRLTAGMASIGKTPPGWSGGQAQPTDIIYKMPQMPQPSANMGGQYRLSPGVYGTEQQAMQQYNQELANMGIQNARVGRPIDYSGMVYQNQRMPMGQRR